MPDNNDNIGRMQTRLLFKQYNPKGEECLEDWRERFVNELDPTEYKGAIELMGSWEKWVQFKKNWPTFVKVHLEAWLAEVEVKLKSEAIKSLVNQAKFGKSPAGAAKFLAEGKYKERKPGRPTNGEVERQINIDKQLEKEVANDLIALGLQKK